MPLKIGDIVCHRLYPSECKRGQVVKINPSLRDGIEAVAVHVAWEKGPTSVHTPEVLMQLR